MKTATTFVLALTGILLIGSTASAQIQPVLYERVPGGVMEHTWIGGFGTPSHFLQPLTLTPDSAGYANPSGDHTVAVATNAIPDSGGIVLTVTDPGPYTADYIWEGWMFTGQNNTRRGLLLRGDPTNDFTSCYQFVVQSGGFAINFRRLINQTPTTLGTWNALALGYAGSLPNDTWVHMKVMASGASFRCFMSDLAGQDVELTQTAGVSTPIVDASPLLTGWPGVYNFRFDLGNVPVYFDDLTLSADPTTPASTVSFGALKVRYR